MRISRLLTPLAAAILLAGCATSDPYGGQTQRSSTAMGTGIGAAIGAAAGALSGDGSTSRRDRALIGAAVGAAAGAGMGAYMDRQEQQLRDNLQGSRIEIDRRGDDIVLNMPSSVTFGFDSAELTADARSALNEVANVLTQYTDTRVNIAGHTDLRCRPHLCVHCDGLAQGVVVLREPPFPLYGISPQTTCLGWA